VADVGTSSGGDELIGSATIYAANAILAAANAGAFIATPSASATSIYVNATPGADWSNVTAGKVSVYVTFINVTNI
jgi:roadblock/LC7 domain-containing protein